MLRRRQARSRALGKSMTQVKPVSIYVVDDDSGHSRLIEKNLRRSGIGNEIEVFSDGRDVLNRMQNERKQDQPILILLDLNMPGLSGKRVLKKLKTDERTKQVPVIVLTTSDSPEEIKECYELGCNLFMTKPMRYEKFAENVRQLGLVFQIVETVPVS